MDRSEFSEVVQRFDRWRTVAKALGQQPYDAPAFEDERLYFRSDYAEQIAKWPRAREEGDWGAYIIDPTSGGMYCVVRSLWHERATHRSEAVEAVFSRAEDAGKYIIARVASSIRFDNGLTSQTVLWREQGLGLAELLFGGDKASTAEESELHEPMPMCAQPASVVKQGDFSVSVGEGRRSC